MYLEECQKAVLATQDVEKFLNKVLSVTLPAFHATANSMAAKVRGIVSKEKDPIEACTKWPSCFSALAYIVNRDTPLHRDGKAWNSSPDLLCSIGDHTGTKFTVWDLDAEFLYDPSTVIILHGRALRHGVLHWDGGARGCIAHYMRDSLLKHYEMRENVWDNYAQFSGMMDGNIKEYIDNLTQVRH